MPDVEFALKFISTPSNGINYATASSQFQETLMSANGVTFATKNMGSSEVTLWVSHTNQQKVRRAQVLGLSDCNARTLTHLFIVRRAPRGPRLATSHSPAVTPSSSVRSVCLVTSRTAHPLAPATVESATVRNNKDVSSSFTTTRVACGFVADVYPCVFLCLGTVQTSTVGLASTLVRTVSWWTPSLALPVRPPSPSTAGASSGCRPRKSSSTKRTMLILVLLASLIQKNAWSTHSTLVESRRVVALCCHLFCATGCGVDPRATAI